MRKIIALLLIFSMVLAMSPSAFAADKKVVTVYTEITQYYDGELDAYEEIAEEYNKKGLKSSTTEYRSTKNGYTEEFDSTEYQTQYRPKWHLLDTLKVTSVYRGLRLVYTYDDNFHDDFIISEELKIEYYD